jgi:hypothetical protein
MPEEGEKHPTFAQSLNNQRDMNQAINDRVLAVNFARAAEPSSR